ncbi:MAG: hypothetical protein R3F37_01550 [Candidatus Competibacteraceae bacterium]
MTISGTTAGGLIASLLSGGSLTFGSATISGSASEGINWNNSAAALTINGGSLQNNGGGAEFFVLGNTANISYAGTITDPSGLPVYIENTTGGAKTFSGSITGNSISLLNNGGATINFTGGVALSSGSNTAFNATGGGTINVTGSNNTLTSTTGRALNVVNTTIGASGLTFQSISAGTGAGSSGVGITLDGTGLGASNGGLTVTGTGTPGSGGTIQRKTGADNSTTAGIGIFLKDTKNPSFSWMQLNDFDNSAIAGRNVQGFTLQNSVISGVIGTSSAPVEGPINFGITNPGGTNGLQGTGLIRNVKISGGIEHNLEFYNQSGSMNLTIDGTNVVSEGANPNIPGDDTADCIIEENSLANGSDGVLIEMQNTATATIVIDRCLFRDNKSQPVQVNALNDSVVTLTIDESVARRFDLGNEGFVLSNATNADMTALVSNNRVNNFGGTATFVGQTPGNASASSLLNATISNSIITSRRAPTITASSLLADQHCRPAIAGRLRIDGNNVTNNLNFRNDAGHSGRYAGYQPSLFFDATVTNNTVSVGDNVTGVLLAWLLKHGSRPTPAPTSAATP